MDLQVVCALANKIVTDIILTRLPDGYGNFSIKQANAINPKTTLPEDCLIVDMVKDDETKSIYFFING